MTPNQLSALEWAIANLPHSAERSILHDFLEGERKHAKVVTSWLNEQRAIPPVEDYRRLPADLLVFMANWHITLPYKELDQWRMVDEDDQRAGEIAGLPQSRGILRATNGILCFIEQEDHLYEGHIGEWCPDEPDPPITGYKAPRVKKVKEPTKSAKSKSSIQRALAEIGEFDA